MFNVIMYLDAQIKKYVHFIIKLFCLIQYYNALYSLVINYRYEYIVIVIMKYFEISIFNN